MIDLGPHGGYILASYATALVILGWMTVSSILANRAVARRLAALEARDTSVN
jgi:heme exporter protein D